MLRVGLIAIRLYYRVFGKNIIDCNNWSWLIIFHIAKFSEDGLRF